MDIMGFRENDIYVICLKGRLDAITAQSFREKIMRAVDDGERKVLVDGSDLAYVSSAGVRVFFEAAYRLLELSGKLACCSVNENVDKIFSMVDLYSDVALFPSRSEALSSGLQG